MTFVAPRRGRRLIGTGPAADALGIDPATLWRWEQRGLVRPESRTIGGQARWDVDNLREQVRAAYERTRDDLEAPPMTATPDTPVDQPIVAAVVTSELGMLVTWRNDKTPPAGFLTGEIEPGESPADALERECKEEAGLRVVADREIGRRVHPRSGRTMIYVSGKPAGAPDVFVGDAEELAAVRWVSLTEADEAFAPFGGMFEPVHEYLTRAIG